MLAFLELHLKQCQETGRLHQLDVSCDEELASSLEAAVGSDEALAGAHAAQISQRLLRAYGLVRQTLHSTQDFSSCSGLQSCN